MGWVYVGADVHLRIDNLPGTPCEEDPDVPPVDQVRDLIGAFLRGETLIAGRDYKNMDRRRGLWKWKTRTVRMGGFYLDQFHFVIVHLDYALRMKSAGRSVPDREREFSQATRDAVEGMGFTQLVWMTQDPYNDKS